MLTRTPVLGVVPAATITTQLATNGGGYIWLDVSVLSVAAVINLPVLASGVKVYLYILLDGGDPGTYSVTVNAPSGQTVQHIDGPGTGSGPTYLYDAPTSSFVFGVTQFKGSLTTYVATATGSLTVA